MMIQPQQPRQPRQLRQTSQMTSIHQKNKQIKFTSTLTYHFAWRCIGGTKLASSLQYTSMHYKLSHYYLPILQKQHIIHPHLPTTPQITHHIPMQSRLIHSTRLRITRTKRQVYRTTHLLIEKRIPDSTIHTCIIPKGKLTQVTCSGIQFQHLLQKTLSLHSTRLNYPPLTKNQPYIFNCMATIRSRHIKRNHPFSAILDWPGKEFPAWKITPAIAINKHPVFNS